MTSRRRKWRRAVYNPKNKTQQEELLTLLGEAFGRTYRPYYELQLETVASTRTTFLLANEEDRLVGHVQVVPYEAFLEAGQAPIKCAYLYAVCTLECERGQGVMQSLLNQVLDVLPRQGYQASLLLPADQDLVGYYKRFGFEVMAGKVYTKIPKSFRPAIRPGAEAQLFLERAEVLDNELSSSAPSTPRATREPIIELPHSANWMSRPLLGSSFLPKECVLLSPMT